MRKYAILEIERRRVAIAESLPELSQLPSCILEDRYIHNTRLRLRKETHSNGKIVYKLCKKYGKESPISEEIVNTYLEQPEYELLLALPSSPLRKTRYFDTLCDINVFENGIITIEKEFSSKEEASDFIAPQYCGLEISHAPDRESASIANQ